VPKGRGLWPAFWLAPADQTWPPEIDVFEVHGDRLEGYWATVHQQPDPNRFTLRWQDHFSQSNQFRIPTPDLSLDFHDYGVEWGPYDIIWTFDGQQVAKARTPPDAHKPMMLILNLAVGGRWPGAPDSSTHFPATLQVQHIRVYHLNPDEGGSP
jgi:beta-glucanase (GH16 family)